MLPKWIFIVPFSAVRVAADNNSERGPEVAPIQSAPDHDTDWEKAKKWMRANGAYVAACVDGNDLECLLADYAREYASSSNAALERAELRADMLAKSCDMLNSQREKAEAERDRLQEAPKQIVEKLRKRAHEFSSDRGQVPSDPEFTTARHVIDIKIGIVERLANEIENEFITQARAALVDPAKGDTK